MFFYVDINFLQKYTLYFDYSNFFVLFYVKKSLRKKNILYDFFIRNLESCIFIFILYALLEILKTQF